MTDKVKLSPLTEELVDQILTLEVTTDQRRFVPPVSGILARAWVYRKQGAQLYVIRAEGKCVGLTLVYELDEEPACYFLMEMIIDRREQNKGYGTAAVRKLARCYAQSPKYPMIELSVDRENHIARHVYEKAGFVDSGYVDPDLPQYVNLVYRF